eukprot:s582_g22.t1
MKQSKHNTCLILLLLLLLPRETISHGRSLGATKALSTRQFPTSVSLAKVWQAVWVARDTGRSIKECERASRLNSGAAFPDAGPRWEPGPLMRPGPPTRTKEDRPWHRLRLDFGDHDVGDEESSLPGFAKSWTTLSSKLCRKEGQIDGV